MRQLSLILFLLLGGLVMPAYAQSSDVFFATTLIDQNERPIALTQWRGRPLIVNFWARWCPPCRKEIPDLIQFRKEYARQGIEVIGIALEDQVEPIREFARTYDMDYPILLARDKGIALMRALGNTKMGLPFTVAIARDGKIVLVKAGLITPQELTQAAELLQR